MPSSSKVSIASLLENVKGVFDDVISADVAKHLDIERTRSEFSDALKFSTRGKPDPDTEELLRIHNEYREAQNDLAESKRKLNELADPPKYLALIDEILNQKASRFSPEGRAKLWSM